MSVRTPPLGSMALSAALRALCGLFVALLVMIACLGLIVAIFRPSGDGIIPHESGKAVYITGTGCTVDTMDAMPITEIDDLLAWCAEQTRADRASRGLEEQ